PVRNIPNGVDLAEFQPVPKDEARGRLGLDPQRGVVLFSAPNLDDRRKGGVVLEEALLRVQDLDFDVVVVGGNGNHLPVGARHLGSLRGERLALSYAAADVFVMPTL